MTFKTFVVIPTLNSVRSGFPFFGLHYSLGFALF